MSQAQLFDLDTELLHFVPEEERATAARRAEVVVERIPPGPWDPSTLDAPAWGLLIADGMLAREVTVAGSGAAELLGAGDVIAMTGGLDVSLVPSQASWVVLETARVALLDERVAPLLRRWPEVGACLTARVERRADRLAVGQAISHLTRVDARVLTMLWLLADRWGRVTPSGIVLPLRLTHRTIARLVGARRPSVTTAITQLSSRGLLSRRTDGSWTLHGPPPEELERVGAGQRVSAVPAPAPRHEEKPPAATLEQIAEQVRRLTESYERQRERAGGIRERARVTRERARELREETRDARTGLTSARADAPPSG